MNFHVEIMLKDHEKAYEFFLRSHENAMFYHSLAYRNFLLSILSHTTPYYFVAIEDDNIIAVLPLIMKKLSSKKTILNGLPFYGSHGGILISEKHRNKLHDIIGEIFSSVSNLMNRHKSISLTVIEPLYNNDLAEYFRNFYIDYFSQPPVDKRIAQVTNIFVEEPDIQSVLMSRFHSKTRNMVRKGLKAGFDIDHDESMESLKEIYELHCENMKVIGGKPKSLKVFEKVHKHFTPNKDYRIYRAKLEGKTAAMLLVFFYKSYCEYFTPVINSNFRQYQPLSAIIFHAMCHAAQEGYRYWNWGGTWESQKSVYFFKKRWGADESQYYYHNKIFDKKYLLSNLDNILEEAENFYIVPFSNIERLTNEVV